MREVPGLDPVMWRYRGFCYHNRVQSVHVAAVSGVRIQHWNIEPNKAIIKLLERNIFLNDLLHRKKYEYINSFYRQEIKQKTNLKNDAEKMKPAVIGSKASSKKQETTLAWPYHRESDCRRAWII